MSSAQESDIFDVLESDHRALIELLSESAVGDDALSPSHCERLVMQVVRHFVAEEQYLLPLVRDQLPGGEQASEVAFDQHRAVEDQLRRLDLPAVLEMAYPARRRNTFLALIALSGDSAVVRIEPGRDLTVPVADIERHWTRRALIPWPAPTLLKAGADPLQRAQEARTALTRLGYDVSDLDRAVTRFQEQADLVPDGTIGSRTLLALYALSEHDRPALKRGAP